MTLHDFASARSRSLAGTVSMLSSFLLLFACGDPAPVVVDDQSTVPADQEPGAADGTLFLDSTAVRLAGIEIITVDTASGGFLVANGTIAYNEDRVGVVAPRVEGRIVRVDADLGQRVRVGEQLALLESADVGQIRGEIESARARMDVARENHQREVRLFQEKISSQKETLEAEATYRVARADFRSAEARLASSGADSGSGATYPLLAPVSGVVVARQALPGQLVGPEASLFTVADLSQLWMTADVYESDLPRVQQGAVATVTPRALGKQSFVGTVAYAGGIVDTTTRTFKVRVVLQNDAGVLRPGMYASVRIATPSAGPPVIWVPEEAVQEVDGRTVVFLVDTVPGRFVIRPVTIDSSATSEVVGIIGGLAPGERIVGHGAFQLKAELMAASLGEDE